MPGMNSQNFSGATSREIDEEVRRIIDGCYQRAETLLRDNVDILHAMKEALVEYETLNALQVDDLMARRPVRPPEDWHDSDFGGTKPTGTTSRSSGNAKPEAPIGGPVEER
jgi:cell division protease FtsH